MIILPFSLMPFSNVQKLIISKSFILDLSKNPCTFIITILKYQRVEFRKWVENFTYSPKWCQRDHRSHDRVLNFSSHLSVKFGQGKQIYQHQSILRSIKHILKHRKCTRKVEKLVKSANENKQLFLLSLFSAPK